MLYQCERCGHHAEPILLNKGTAGLILLQRCCRCGIVFDEDVVPIPIPTPVTTAA